MTITPITRPLPGERVVALWPDDRAAAAATWLRRPNLFPGRALTAPTLDARAAWQAGHVTQRGQAFTTGVVRGLEVGTTTGEAPDGGGRRDVRVRIGAGRGLTVGGEDVVLLREAEADLWALPVVAPPGVFEGEGFGGGGVLQPRAIGPTLGALLDTFPDALPRAGALVLQPVSVEHADIDPDDPCDRCGCGDDGDVGFEDWRRGDAARLLWYAWPEDWQPLPPADARFRNRLAWTVFEAERRLGTGEVLPWEEIGLPVALVGVDDAFLPTFADRHAVVRQGGRARSARLLLAADPRVGAGLEADARMPGLWQARIEQLAEQVAELGDPAPDALASGFDRLPPCGLLPRSVIDLEDGSSAFFPGGFDLDAVPVPLEQLDVALREAAGLAPLDLARGERVRLLVPVTQASWEPRLLLKEEIDPEFAATLERFLVDRGRALAGRQSIRLKSAVLLDALKGEAPPVPAIGDDPEALEPESLGAWGPPPGAGSGHRSSLASGAHEHGFGSASATLTPNRGDRLYAWVYLDPEHPPRTLMLEWRSGRAEHRAYWGENLLDRGSDGRVTRLRVGDLPEPGRWIRLEVKAAAMEYEGSDLDGMGFVLYDGQAAYGPTGSVSADGETVWFEGVPPKGAKTAGDEPFAPLTANQLLAPFEPAYGVVANADDPDAPSGTSAALGALAADPRLTDVLSGSEQAQLPERGVDGFIVYLKARADRADDLVDYGFLKVQTDIYRVRQLVLGTTDATRLAVSPTLAGIAKAETAVASNESISTFFDRLRDAKSRAAAASSGDDASAPASSRASSDASSGGASPGNVVFNAVARVSQPLVGFERVSTPELSNAVMFPTDAEEVRAQTKASTPFARATTYTPSDVTSAPPLVGKYDVRTLSIAERLELPKAQEARDYATATRHEAVLGLVRLADRLIEEDGEVPGLFEDIDVWGLEGDDFVPGGEDPVAALKRPLRDFITRDGRATLFAALLRPPMRDIADEAAHFSDSADMADRTIALLRQVEGRVKRYREAIAACEEARGSLQADLSRLGVRERDWATRLAEARHDVAVTRALIAEEEARLDAINARRAEILAREVRFVAFVRPRTSDTLRSAASRPLDPGLLEAPAPACLRAEEDVPDELRAMLAVVREAPADWFRLQTRLLDHLDRVDLLVKAVKTAQLRTQLARTRTASSSFDTGAVRGLPEAIGKVQAVQRRRVDLVRAGALQLDATRLAGLSWQGVRAEAAKVVSIGDLMDGEHGKGGVARNAAAFFERFGRICGCLHAAFSDVGPAIRLDWAETLSQFDRTPNLRNLSTLSRWSEIDYVDRRRLQGLADWLYDQLDPREPRAQELVSDVVRMCLLLASHAPVGRIVAGRVPRPVTARPGLHIPLVPLDPSRLRIGMQALVYRADTIVARAVVEDLGRAEASARVTHAAGSSVELDENVRVHFADATEVAFAPASSAVGRG